MVTAWLSGGAKVSASITGLFMLAVFVIRSPKSGFEMLIYLLVACGLLFGTMQHRKGFAIGLLYVHDLLFGEEVEENKPNEGTRGNVDGHIQTLTNCKNTLALSDRYHSN